VKFCMFCFPLFLPRDGGLPLPLSPLSSLGPPLFFYFTGLPAATSSFPNLFSSAIICLSCRTTFFLPLLSPSRLLPPPPPSAREALARTHCPFCEFTPPAVLYLLFLRRKLIESRSFPFLYLWFFLARTASRLVFPSSLRHESFLVCPGDPHPGFCKA